MSDFFHRLGVELALKSLNERSFSPLINFMFDANSPDPARSGPAAPIWRSAIVEIAAALEKIQAKNMVTLTPVPPTENELVYASLTSPKEYQRLSNLVVASFKAVNKSSLRGLVFSDDRFPKRGEKQGDANNQKPLEVKIVAMPSRETIATIERDANGEISGSLHVEKDN